MQHTIEISKGYSTWIVKSGTNTQQTPYSLQTCAEVVLKAIQRLNPGCVVRVNHSLDKAAFL
jgi:hypothetical protein